MALPLSETKLIHRPNYKFPSPLHSGNSNLQENPSLSHPVVVDQLVSLHFILHSDGSLALYLLPAVFTDMLARTCSNKHDTDQLTLVNLLGNAAHM